MRTAGKMSLKSGLRLPLFKAGQESPSTGSSSDMNLYVRAINALLNMKIRYGDKDEFEVTDENSVLQLAMSPFFGNTTTNSSGFASPLDSACYVPAIGGHGEFIAAVRGSRIYTFDAGFGTFTGNKVDFNAGTITSPIIAPSFGIGTIIYEPANDRLWASAWNGWFNWSHAATWAWDQYVIEINPSSLAITGGHEMNSAYSAGLGKFGSQGFHKLLFNPTTGWIDAVMVQNSAGASISTGTGGFLVIDPASPNTALATLYDKSGIDGWVDGCVGFQNPGVRDDFWAISPGTSTVLCFDTIANSLRLTISIGFATIPYCIEYCPDNDSVYFGTAGGHNSYTSAGVNTTGGGSIGGDAMRVRWNPADHKLYWAVPPNTIAVMDPNSGDSVVLKTGFDLPCDIVMVPASGGRLAAAWAVQQGSPGLQQIV